MEGFLYHGILEMRRLTAGDFVHIIAADNGCTDCDGLGIAKVGLTDVEFVGCCCKTLLRCSVTNVVEVVEKNAKSVTDILILNELRESCGRTVGGRGPAVGSVVRLDLLSLGVRFCHLQWRVQQGA